MLRQWDEFIFVTSYCTESRLRFDVYRSYLKVVEMEFEMSCVNKSGERAIKLVFCLKMHKLDPGITFHRYWPVFLRYRVRYFKVWYLYFMSRRLPVRANICVRLGPYAPGRAARQLSRQVALKVVYGLGLLDYWDYRIIGKRIDRSVTG